MITCYARGGRMDLAERLFDEMPEKDTVSWTAVLHGYLLNRDVDSAWKLFNKMPDKDTVTWNTMMGGFVQNGMFEDALRLFDAMPERERDIVSCNTILQGYVRKGDMANANYFFGRMRVEARLRGTRLSPDTKEKRLWFCSPRWSEKDSSPIKPR
uniref:Pentatricopeptide repeat-containing protein n=1 Tax=Ananas comosus var. bracteatus TaxID=296719 RepID=A0A6V7NQN2_ANACO|nr:unnamed protein product [Ananas comosus var. bracteatus]